MYTALLRLDDISRAARMHRERTPFVLSPEDATMVLQRFCGHSTFWNMWQRYQEHVVDITSLHLEDVSGYHGHCVDT